VIATAHVLKRPPPLTSTPTKAASSNILGLGNIINIIIKHLPEDLEKYVPNWDRDGSIRSPENLLSIAQRKRNSIRAGANNSYTRPARRALTTTRRAPTTNVANAVAPPVN